ncbi:hypothetical protein A3A46_00015 [Candidatus Roizmanbacteria bacterium RIFCSPLOWO2_01_FULL_37_13]|uniref:HEPN domain-containing protein n=1 Tax=Candidatus Roizmanbacteria bacterium RIFCSPHIGHO2_02_FULL_38_11 TaxID=1802039 RepID=A0A1F7H2S1_9BACT|nr:MAG: hypothetical protein A3C25_04590 [Candidatus Roizmanbacteria bacterium RIFCSPHIGHO2_02_FULL_38_11]OGK32974.1 MAG: hypothetical protein A3F58_03880 [Candidatus Roizmanbacteria bacterium RIFCSPHIGHO2_12_FULL_37_9b]OGK42930.1 MAG: hypothetical protein A3A46_00015 [Candidatus Roizmanbacteria bacterium RIFCSPLOWO2_01_FULL_37_13]
MTIKIDHLNMDRSEDPGFWYLWALEFNNTFRLLFSYSDNFLKKSHNINTDPPPPSHIVMWTIYAHTLELYMKTYLLALKAVQISDLRYKYSHDLERLRQKCAELEPQFNNKYLTWITQDLKKFTKIDWEYIKYPPKIPPLSKKPKLRDIQHTPGMYGKKTMLPPLDLLEKIIKPLVYIND